MTNFIKHIRKVEDEPFTVEIKLKLEALEATFAAQVPIVSPGETPNTVKITLDLYEISSNPSTFEYTFNQILEQYDNSVDITILIKLNNSNGPIITHQETGGHEGRPGGLGTA